MRLSISNIAWDIDEDSAVYNLLQKYGIDAIDIAPGKYFPNPIDAKEKDINKVKSWWQERGIAITGMQAILFGTQGLNVFGSDNIQNRLLSHLQEICRIAGHLGAHKIVFGSPKNRDRGMLTDTETVDKAHYFFSNLGDIAQKHGVKICLEPNPPCYGANYMIDSTETACVVQQINHSAIKMQFDTGALFINNEAPEYVLSQYSSLIGHVHISEPNLTPLGDTDIPHQYISSLLKKYLPEHIATIEMLTTQNESHLSSIERSLILAIKNYRGKGV